VVGGFETIGERVGNLEPIYKSPFESDLEQLRSQYQTVEGRLAAHINEAELFSPFPEATEPPTADTPQQ